ncbi:hypothetical protein KEJ43_05980, partial [Candidatus Bathyarchaeota archaeon]|nr:hypothetical protein [Candidatus Bathyarchaeota archaeon]
LGPKDRVIDEGVVKVYVDGSREIRAMWRRDYTRLLFALILIGICLIASIMLLMWKTKRSVFSLSLKSKKVK